MPVDFLLYQAELSGSREALSTVGPQKVHSMNVDLHCFGTSMFASVPDSNGDNDFGVIVLHLQLLCLFRPSPVGTLRKTSLGLGSRCKYIVTVLDELYTLVYF